MLASIPEDEFAVLRPLLEPVPLPRYQVLYEQGQKIEHAYFLNTGMISLVVIATDGRSVEVGISGREGVVGLPAAFGFDDAPTRALTEAIRELARNVKAYYGAWHENPYAFAVFGVAVETLLSKMRPKGEPVAPSNTDEWLPGDTPEIAGVNLARATIIARNL